MEFVCVTVAWGDWTLRYSVNTIILHVVELTKTMPVDSCSITWKMITHGHFNIVSPTSFDPRPRIRRVKHLALSILATIRIKGLCRDVEGILPGFTFRVKALIVRVDVVSPLF
jgi:hypothetical protein